LARGLARGVGEGGMRRGLAGGNGLGQGPGWGAGADAVGWEPVELPDNPFNLATLFHPQVGSFEGEPLHQIIGEFVAAF